MPFQDVNLLPVLVAGVVAYAIGALWYSPVLFGNKWMALMGLKKESMPKEGMGKSYAAGFVATLVMSYVLALFILATEMAGWTGGAFVGFWVWLGFVATVTFGSILWENKPFSLFALNNGHYLVVFMVMGAILGGWM